MSITEVGVTSSQGRDRRPTGRAQICPIQNATRSPIDGCRGRYLRQLQRQARGARLDGVAATHCPGGHRCARDCVHGSLRHHRRRRPGAGGARRLSLHAREIARRHPQGAYRVAHKVCAAVEGLDIEHPDSPIANRLTVSVGIASATLAVDSNWEELEVGRHGESRARRGQTVGSKQDRRGRRRQRVGGTVFALSRKSRAAASPPPTFDPCPRAAPTRGRPVRRSRRRSPSPCPAPRRGA